MTDGDSGSSFLPDHAVAACLGLIAERGWFGFALRDVAAQSERSLADLYRVYPSKLALVRGFLAAVDAGVLDGDAPVADESVRDRLFDVMMRRFDLLLPHRPAIERLRVDLRRDPLAAVQLARAVERSMAAVLEAAGISAEGIGGGLRRRGLLLVEARVLPVFCQDDSVDLSKTMAALDRQLKAGERWMGGLDRWTARLRPPARAVRAEDGSP